ncbi:MAG TPA: hypothetical protein VKQ54_03625 [Caulobacteraceae bacterium]|nr:hypothetical protein [Caulobacteraceae bacterium]
MNVRDIAEFCTEFPDDSIEDERGFVRYPGLGVAEALAQMFRDMGFQVPAPEGEAELGWVLDVHVGKRRYWFRLSDLGDRVILVSRDTTRYGPTPGDIGHGELLGRLDTAMKADGRFSDVGWYTEAEYQRAREAPDRARRKMPLSLRLQMAARAVVLFGIALLFLVLAVVEFGNALMASEDGHMRIAGMHALACVSSIVACLWGLPRVVMWLDTKGL